MKKFQGLSLSILFLSLISTAALAMPSTVILIRHAEKTKDKENIHLSAKGYERAAALPSFFKKHSAVPLIRLVAQGQKHSESSLRPIETLIPSSKDFKTEINHQFVKDEAKEMVSHLVSSTALNKKTVVVSWGHDEIGEISQRLGKDNGEWPSAIFDRAWIFQYNTQGKLVKFSNVPQSLLSGDSEE